jgi:hypothetical protein
VLAALKAQMVIAICVLWLEMLADEAAAEETVDDYEISMVKALLFKVQRHAAVLIDPSSRQSRRHRVRAPRWHYNKIEGIVTIKDNSYSRNFLLRNKKLSSCSLHNEFALLFSTRKIKIGINL